MEESEEDKSSDGRTNLKLAGSQSEVGKKKGRERPRLEYFPQIMNDIGFETFKKVSMGYSRLKADGRVKSIIRLFTI